MIASFATIAALLSGTQRQTRQRHLRLVLTLYPAYGLLYATMFAGAVFVLLQAWRGERWMDFWTFGFSAFPAGFILVTIMEWVDFREYLFARVTILREAARTADETLAPIAVDGDDEDPASEPSAIESTHVGPLHRPAAVYISPFTVVASMLVIALVLIVPGLLASDNIVPGTALAMILVLGGGALGLLAYRTFGPLYARVDADGVYWPAIVGRSHHLPWSEVKSFLRATEERQITDYRRTVYAVVGERAAFAWAITGDASETIAGAASRRMVQTIVHQADLPLRDLSGEARRLAHRKHSGFSSRRRIRVLAIGCAPFLLLLLVAGVLQVAQPWYFAHLYTRAHSSTPLYADTLTHPDGDWPITDTNAFADGAYIITRDQGANRYYPSLIPPPHRFDNALYEVTSRIYGYPSVNFEGAGVAILGSDLSQPILAFKVTPTGNWVLERLTSLGGGGDDKLVDFDYSTSTIIDRGFGAPNRIAMLVQSGTFTFYINGHYVTRYYDAHFAGGRVGLYLDPLVDHGSFTDFAIYPV